jgi:hypothetical protein
MNSRRRDLALLPMRILVTVMAVAFVRPNREFLRINLVLLIGNHQVLQAKRNCLTAMTPPVAGFMAETAAGLSGAMRSGNCC